MFTFVGVSDSTGHQVYRIGGGKCVKVDPRYDLRRHSPAGFNWGYNGSGPAQLALAILADVTGDAEATLQLYQRFKLAVISDLPREGFVLHQHEVEAWLIGNLALMTFDDDAIELGEEP